MSFFRIGTPFHQHMRIGLSNLSKTEATVKANGAVHMARSQASGNPALTGVLNHFTQKL